ncbi:MAG: sigma-54 dependent transcriptional regulator [Candidatus Riflebacteria bacterium]|nr:sigma-54 dependent transcriptional regulator [Candidatus Riflebacteria bacterium]
MSKDYRATVLVTDDEASYRNMIKTVLEDAGFEVLPASSGQQALEIILRRSIDVAVLDLMMPGMDGRELMARLLKKIPELPVIFLTAHGSIASAVAAVKDGAADYLTKPLPHVDDLLNTVERVLELSRLKRQQTRKVAAKVAADPFPCASPNMKKILEMAARVAATDVTVLITGESGTGKERMAEFIHLNSPRSTAEMVSVNCAAIVDTLLESELFGHEKGAFTGAVDRKPGRFEESDNSTLFLDEIGEMSIGLQPKLLRALQEKEFRRVGGSQVIRFNARMIAATNRNLKQQCTVGAFREDLFYRISVFTLHIPPLRERPEDIVMLSYRFVKEAAARFARPAPEIADKTREVLLNYGWPGNVRELANVIEASVLLCDDEQLHPRHLHGIALEDQIVAVSGVAPDKDMLAAAERNALVEALSRFDGNRVNTAEFLNMSRRNLIYKLKKHGLLNRDK